MKQLVYLLLILSLVGLIAAPVKAQNASDKESVGDQGDDLDSGYVHKPKGKRRKNRRPASDETSGPSLSQNTAQKKSAAPDAADPASSSGSPVAGPAAGPDSTPEVGAGPQPKPSWGHRMQDMFLGGDPEAIDKYRTYLNVEDVRKNIIEFTLASTYMYNTSLSAYYPRNYIDSGPGADVGIDLWVTPFFGIDANYRTSILNEIQDPPATAQYLAATQNWFGLGLKFRRFFGMAMNSPSINVSLKFSNYTLSLPPSAQYRSNQTVQGPELDIDLNVPASKRYSWLFGLAVQPYLTATESNRSGNYLSGTSNQTAAFGANLGGEYRLSRQTSAFFKFSSMFYMSQFSGQASAADPTTGATPNGVPVSNMFYFIDLGVKLGR